jgi:hypothetical protein
MIPEQEFKVMLQKLEPEYELKDGKVYGVYEVRVIYLMATGFEDCLRKIDSDGLLNDYKVHKVKRKYEDFRK